MSLSVQEVKDILLSALPPKFRRVLGPGQQLYYEGIAEQLKLNVSDLSDTLRLEVNPVTCTKKVPDWELALGLTQTPAATTGEILQRRAQILAKLRENSSLSIPDVQSVMQPFFLYTDPTQIEVIETDRSQLQTAHTYSPAGLPATIIGPNSGIFSIAVADDGPVSDAGAQVTVEISGPLSGTGFSLTRPDGQGAYWPPSYLSTGTVTNQSFVLYAPQLKGFQGVSVTNGVQSFVNIGSVGGTWRFTAFTSAGNTLTVTSVGLFVEGVGLDGKGGNGLGAAMFDWGVVADANLLGTGFDLISANLALQRIKPAWTTAHIILKNAGALANNAIPDAPQTIPDQIVPGT